MGNCEVTRHVPELLKRFRSLGPGDCDSKTRHRRIDGNLPSPTLTAGTPTGPRAGPSIQPRTGF